MLKKNHIILTLSLFAFSVAPIVHADIFDIFDDPDAEAMMADDDISELAEHTRVGANPETIIMALESVHAINLLKEEFYKHTNVLNKRSLLDQPLFDLHRCKYTDRWSAGFHIFFNQMKRSFFTESNSRLCSYLNLDSNTFINALENLVPFVREEFDDPDLNIDIAKVFAIFSGMSVEQRQAGAMIHGMRRWKQWRLRFFAPLYYLERNFFINEEEQEIVANEFGTDPSEADEEFQNEHFVSDKFGVGDLRLEAEALAINKPEFKMHIGAQATVPIAFTIVNGLRGTQFKKSSCLPKPGLIEKLFCLFLDDQHASRQDKIKAFEKLSEFGLDAINRLAANLLDTKLGNDGHLGLGLLFRIKNKLKYLIKRPWARSGKIINKISIEYLFPANEKRAFVEKNNNQDFDERDFNDPAQARANLTFIEEELIKRLFPIFFDVNISPGFIFHWISKLCFQSKDLGGLVGFDMWAKSSGKFGSINACGNMHSYIDIPKAKSPLAYQLKLFAGINYKLVRPKRTWHISLNGDGTPSSVGIGKDFSITLNVEAHF